MGDGSPTISDNLSTVHIYNKLELPLSCFRSNELLILEQEKGNGKICILKAGLSHEVRFLGSVWINEDRNKIKWISHVELSEEK